MKSQVKAIEKPKTEKIEIEEIRETIVNIGKVRKLAD